MFISQISTAPTTYRQLHNPPPINKPAKNHKTVVRIAVNTRAENVLFLGSNKLSAKYLQFFSRRWIPLVSKSTLAEFIILNLFSANPVIGDKIFTIRLVMRPSWNKGRNMRYPAQLTSHHLGTKTTSTQRKSTTYNNSTSILVHYFGVCGSAVGRGTALQIGRSPVRFPRVSVEFFVDVILPAALWSWGWLSL